MAAKKRGRKAKNFKKGVTKKSISKKRRLLAPKKKLKKKKSSHKRFEDPLEVEMPPRWLNAKASKKILSLRKLQYRMWGWTVALSIFLLLSVATIEILSDFDIIPSPSLAHHDAMKNGDVLAIFVIGLELVHGFTRAKNKALYLKQNWLAILAIMPLGLFVRVGRAFEGWFVLEGIAELRSLQMAGKFGELRAILPVLELPYELNAFVLEPLITRVSSITRGTASAVFGVAKISDDVLEYIFRVLK